MTFTGYIYKITGTCGGLYIGSTINIKRRMESHNCKNNNCSTKLLTKPLQYEIIDSREYKLVKTLRLVEQFYLDNNNTVNEVRAYSNLELKREQILQYRINNKELLKELKKQYNFKNKEIIKQKKAISYIKNREKILKQKKEYHIKNREILKKKRKEYYNKNKEKINLKSKVKIKCECGCMVVKSYLPKHKTTSKHINLLNK